MHATAAVLAAICSLAAALPTTQLVPRAGGPAIDPIPSNCTITPPDPAYANFIPTSDAITDAELYPMYYEPADESTAAQQCLEQCYGYGDHTECGGAYYADNINVPKGYYGSDGTQYASGCLLFNRTLTVDDFQAAPQGQALNAFVGNIACPTS